MVKNKLLNKKIIGASIIFLVVIILGGIISFYFLEIGDGEGDFEVDRLFLKTVLEVGGSTKTNLHILNNAPNFPEFSTKVNEIEEFVFISEEDFILNVGDEKIVDIQISTLNDTDPGVYLGNIEVSSGGLVKQVPVSLEIHTPEILFSSNINFIPSGTDFLPGQKLNAEIRIFNLANLGRSNVQLIYFVKDFSGRTIVSESEEVTVEGGSLSISKTLDLPSNLRLGDYVFIVLTKYNGSVGTSSKIFKIVEPTDTAPAGFESRTLLIIVFVFGFFFLVFMILLIYSIFYRDRLLKELQKQYKSELRRQKELIKVGEKQAYAKLKGIAEKKAYRVEAEQVARQRMAALKDVQKKRVREFNKIKRTKKISELKKQMEKWKKQGYDTGVLEKRFKLPSVSSVRKKISKWKKQGYDTSVLERKLEKR